VERAGAQPDRRKEEADVIRIDVDYNARDRDGLVKVSRRRADGDFVAGDVVELYDASDPEMTFQGRIEDVDVAGRGVARVEWADAVPSPGSTVVMTWPTVEFRSEAILKMLQTDTKMTVSQCPVDLGRELFQVSAAPPAATLAR